MFEFGEKKKRMKVPRGLLGRLYRRSGARCEGYKLGLDCNIRLTEDSKPHVHHKDGNPRNNKMSNLLLLCPNCHSRVTKIKKPRRSKTPLERYAERIEEVTFGKRAIVSSLIWMQKH